MESCHGYGFEIAVHGGYAYRANLSRPGLMWRAFTHVGHGMKKAAAGSILSERIRRNEHINPSVNRPLVLRVNR